MHSSSEAIIPYLCYYSRLFEPDKDSSASEHILKNIYSETEERQGMDEEEAHLSLFRAFYNPLSNSVNCRVASPTEVIGILSQPFIMSMPF